MDEVGERRRAGRVGIRLWSQEAGDGPGAERHARRQRPGLGRRQRERPRAAQGARAQGQGQQGGGCGGRCGRSDGLAREVRHQQADARAHGGPAAPQGAQPFRTCRTSLRRTSTPRRPSCRSPPRPASCGQVWTGTEYIGVDCINAPDLHSKHPKAAKVVVAYATMKQPAGKLPKVVDHRLDGTEGVIRKQGGIECSAFAFTAALDHAYARWTGTPAEFSVMQVWARYHTPSETDGRHGEPGRQARARGRLAVRQERLDVVGQLLQGPVEAEEERMRQARRRREAQGARQARPGRDHPDRGHRESDVRNCCARSWRPGRTRRWASSCTRSRSRATRGTSTSSASPPRRVRTAGMEHEILLAGYAMTPNGTYYLIHNSWGPGWGIRGTPGCTRTSCGGRGSRTA